MHLFLYLSGIVAFLGLTSRVSADSLDYIRCYCAADFDDRVHDGNYNHPPETAPHWAGFIGMIDYQSEVYGRNFTHIYHDEDTGFLHDLGRDVCWQRGWDRERGVGFQVKWPEGVELWLNKWQYKFNHGPLRRLPGWKKPGDEVRSKNKRRETLRECDALCRDVWPAIPDLTSTCNESDWAAGEKHWAFPSHRLYDEYKYGFACQYYHYKALTDQD